MLNSEDIFIVDVDVELDRHSVFRWKTKVQWGLNVEFRSYGIKSISPFAPAQKIDLRSHVSDYIESAEEDLEETIQYCIDEGIDPNQDKDVNSKRKEIETIRSIETLDLSSIECKFVGNSNSEDSSDISIFPIRIEIDIDSKTATLYFQK